MTDIVNGMLLRDQSALMAHRSPQRAAYPDTWSFPGGHVEPGETFDQALVRELSEEISVVAKSWSFISRFSDTKPARDQSVTFHFIVVTAWDGKPTNVGNEHSEIRWVSLADAIKMPGLTFAQYADLLTGLMRY